MSKLNFPVVQSQEEWVAEQVSKEKLPKACTLLVTPHCMCELNCGTHPSAHFVHKAELPNGVFLQVRSLKGSDQ